MTNQSKKWLPLESNPEVFKKYSERLGVAHEAVDFYEIYSLEEDLLSFVPDGVIALLLLFPITEESEKAKTEEERRIEESGQHVSDAVYYMQQTVGNACGTVGILHGIMNNYETLPISPGSFIDEFYKKSLNMSPIEKAKFLECPIEGDPNIEDIHQEVAIAGDTRTPELDEDVNLHFICFIQKDNALYELDGRKKFPVNHGTTSPECFLKDAVSIIKSFIARAMCTQISLRQSGLYTSFRSMLREIKLSRNVRIAVALSGGADSTALLHLTKQWLKEYNECEADELGKGHGSLALNLFNHINNKPSFVKVQAYPKFDPLKNRPLAIVVDHRLRPESEREACEVSRFASEMGFESVVRYIQWENGRPSKSEAMVQARIERYKILYEECIKHKTPVLFTGHHLDDVIETFVIRLLRASGIDGISCIHPVSFLQPGFPCSFNIPANSSDAVLLCRPLLNIRKYELVEYLREICCSWVEDPSNGDTSYLRIKVRRFLENTENSFVGNKFSKLVEDICAVIRLCYHTKKKQEELCIELFKNSFITENNEYERSQRICLDAEKLREGADKAIAEKLLSNLVMIVSKNPYPQRGPFGYFLNHAYKSKVDISFEIAGTQLKLIKIKNQPIICIQKI